MSDRTEAAGDAAHMGSVGYLAPTMDDAQRIQNELVELVEIPGIPGPAPAVVAALDVSYETGTDRVAAAAVLVDTATMQILEETVVEDRVTFPYLPGLLAFREVPSLLRVLDRIRTTPDLLLCDGQGIAHPRYCGLACHLGVRTGLPAIGCAKNHLTGDHTEPGPRRGDRAPLLDGTTVLGHVLRTQDDVRPVYVSPGHRIGTDQATDLVLTLTPTYRLPDPLRRADHISRQALRTPRLGGRAGNGPRTVAAGPPPGKEGSGHA